MQFGWPACPIQTLFAWQDLRQLFVWLSSKVRWLILVQRLWWHKWDTWSLTVRSLGWRSWHKIYIRRWTLKLYFWKTLATSFWGYFIFFQPYWSVQASPPFSPSYNWQPRGVSTDFWIIFAISACLSNAMMLIICVCHVTMGSNSNNNKRIYRNTYINNNERSFIHYEVYILHQRLY